MIYKSSYNFAKWFNTFHITIYIIRQQLSFDNVIKSTHLYVFVTGSEKTDLIYAKFNTLVHIMVHILCSGCTMYLQSISFIEFLIDFCMHDKTVL